MSFLYPDMLFALFALAIPIIIHLFNFRRHKVVYFSNTATLKTIEQENAKTKKLKYIIALIARMLFIMGLVFAFAYPFKPEQNLNTNDDNNLVAIYIDNSMSMQSQSSEITLFEDARTSSRRLIKNLNPATRYVLLSNSHDLENEYPMNLDEMLLQLDNMQSEAAPLSFNEIYENLLMIKKRNGFKTASLFLYSDFQKNMMNLDGIIPDSTIQIVAFPLKSDFQQNIYIDSVWLKSPVLQTGLTNEVFVRISNESGKDIKGLPVNFEIDNHAVAFTTADIQDDAHTDVSMQFIPENVGALKSSISITDYPITFDDKYYFILKVRPVIKIMELTDKEVTRPRVTTELTRPRVTMNLLFSGDSLFNYSAVDPYKLDNQELTSCNMIIVNENVTLNESMQSMILDFAADGGSVVLFPSENQENRSDFLYRSLGLSFDKEPDTNSTRIESLAKQHSFFDDLFVSVPENADLPAVNKHFSVNRLANSNAITLMELQNGDPLLLLSPRNQGNIFIFTASPAPGSSNLSDHAIFVPLLYKMAFLGSRISDLSYTLGVDKYLTINDIKIESDDEISIRDEQHLYEMIPAVEVRNNRIRLNFFDELPSAGFYEIDKNKTFNDWIAWNDSRKESEMQFVDNKDITEIFKDKGFNVLAVMDYDEIHSDDVMKMLVRKSLLWKSFIIMALAALLIEILILRFWKK